jgi:hypothetical protein
LLKVLSLYLLSPQRGERLRGDKKKLGAIEDKINLTVSYHEAESRGQVLSSASDFEEGVILCFGRMEKIGMHPGPWKKLSLVP